MEAVCFKSRCRLCKTASKRRWHASGMSTLAARINNFYIVRELAHETNVQQIVEEDDGSGDGRKSTHQPQPPLR